MHSTLHQEWRRSNVESQVSVLRRQTREQRTIYVPPAGIEPAACGLGNRASFACFPL